LNRYSYVQNNPLKYTDPSGFETVEVEAITMSNYAIDMARLLGLDISTMYTITDEEGNIERVVTTSKEEKGDIPLPGGGCITWVPDPVYIAANSLRDEKDKELNIIMLDDNNSKEEANLYHFEFDRSNIVPTRWGIYTLGNIFGIDVGKDRWDLYWSNGLEAGIDPGPGPGIATILLGLVFTGTPASVFGWIMLGIGLQNTCTSDFSKNKNLGIPNQLWITK
jgi:hypothetical protein